MNLFMCVSLCLAICMYVFASELPVGTGLACWDLNFGPQDCMPSTLSHWAISAAPFLEVNIVHLEFEGLCRGDTKETICISSSEINSSQCFKAFLSYLFQVCLWKCFKKFSMGRQDFSAMKLELHLWDPHSGRRDPVLKVALWVPQGLWHMLHAPSYLSKQSFIVMIYLKSVVLVMVPIFFCI